MQAADYRVVRTRLNFGIMMGIKRSVLHQAVDGYFSSWLYGQQKSTRVIPVDLARCEPCLVCSSDEIHEKHDGCLLNVDLNSFQQCLPLFDRKQLSILNLLLDDDRHVYENAIRQQYEDYRQILKENLRQKFAQQYFPVV